MPFVGYIVYYILSLTILLLFFPANGMNIKLNNAASITVADIEAENGVVHIISHVLIPSTLNPGIVG